MLGITLFISHFENVLQCHYSSFVIEYHFCGCSFDQEIQVLLLPFTVIYITAVNEVTYVIGFRCDGLLDVVCFRVTVTGYRCGEVSFFAHGTSWVGFTRLESRCCWFLLYCFCV